MRKATYINEPQRLRTDHSFSRHCLYS